jgi:predicted 2-oxoglutarate/Fe(II)-dependent dioxygenase YbiX
MTNTAAYFEKNGYVVLTGALDEATCSQLTKYMFDLLNEGKLVKDDQCPLSDAIYGAPVFDKLLQDFAEPLGRHIGKKLLPTYTYSRIYRPGEVLKKHKDRPACEISATLTLGFDKPPVWPIFADEVKQVAIALHRGDMMVYKGCELLHWREEFKGQWHVQVFFHYVDANGPYKDHYRDGRNEFGTQKTMNVTQTPKKVSLGEVKEIAFKDDEAPEQKNPVIKRGVFNSIIIPNNDMSFPGYISYNNGHIPDLKFTEAECDEIIALTKKVYGTPASVGGNLENSAVNKQIRSATIYDVINDMDNRWIYEKVVKAVAIANKTHFDFEISGITHNLQLIEYDIKDEHNPGHYNWHVDAGNGDVAVRKISYVAQISDPRDYEGCELVVNNFGHEITATKERGSIHMFPSYMVHKVTPITRGKRFSLVIWVHGSRRFR